MPSLRAASPADLPLVLRRERAYMEDVEPEHLTRWLDALDRNLTLWVENLERTTVVEVDGEAAGFVMWTQSPDDPGAAVVVTVQVLPENRRTGLGLVLLAAFEEQAAVAGRPRFELGVHRDNPARSLYPRAGYEVVGEDGQYVLMTKQGPAAD